MKDYRDVPWFVVYTVEEVNEYEGGLCGLCISICEDDPCDAFLFSVNFDSNDGIPQGIEHVFEAIVTDHNKKIGKKSKNSEFKSYDTNQGTCAFCGRLTCNGSCFK